MYVMGDTDGEGRGDAPLSVWSFIPRRTSEMRKSPMSTLTKRSVCADARGFTLIELLVVAAVIGVLVAVAVPSYIHFKGRSSDTAAQATIRNARPAVGAYFADNNGAPADADLDPATVGYEGMTIAALRSFDSSISASTLTIGSVSPTSFCLSSAHDGHVWSQGGPTATVAPIACP